MGDFQSTDGMLAGVGWTGKRLKILWAHRYVLPLERQLYGKGFTGAELLPDGDILTCGFNALYLINPIKKTCRPWLVRDDFNDLHDVAVQGRRGERRLIIANTGLDRIDVFRGDGVKLLNRIPLTPLHSESPQIENDPYFDELANADRPIYLRKLRDQVHPNTVLSLKDRIWVSRLNDRALTQVNGEKVTYLPGLPHDLVSWKGRIWTTTTDGRIWSSNPDLRQGNPRCELDSYICTGRSGWIRGLSISERLLIVGCTRISRMPRERWTDRSFAQTETGLLLMNRSDGSSLDWLSLEELGENPKVFGIYSWSRQ